MRRNAKPILLVLTGLLIASGGLASTAGAATYYVAPESARSTPPCERTDPCRLDTALTAATLGEEILLEPGVYYEAGTTPWGNLPRLSDGVLMRGIDPADIPVIHGESRTMGLPVLGMDPGSTLRDLELRTTTLPELSYSYSVRGSVGSLIDRVIVRTTGNGVTYVNACVGAGVTIRNTVCLAEGAGNGVGVTAATSGANFVTNLINVTAISTATAGEGVRLVMSTNHTSVLNLTNSIARGPSADLHTGTLVGMPVGTSRINAEHSNWNTHSTSGGGTNQVVTGAGNQNGATAATPLFRDPAAGDYRAAPGSPTIDAGLSSIGADPLAPGGLTRAIGPAPDIGAYEFALPPVVTNSASSVANGSATLSATVDPAGAPTSAAFRLGKSGGAPIELPAGGIPGQSGPTTVTVPATGLEAGGTYSFRVAAESEGGTTLGDEVSFTVPNAESSGPVLSALKIAKRWRLRKGTSIRIRSRDAVRVRLRFERKRGKKFRGAGTMDVKVRNGLKVRRFKGRVGKRRLRPGAYRLVGVAVAADGTRSKSKLARFRLSR